MRSGRWATAFVIALALAGCGGKVVPQDERISLDKVPPVVMKAARDRLPGITFERAWRQKGEHGAEDTFEVRGRDARGKTREVKVSVSGTVLEIE